MDKLLARLTRKKGERTQSNKMINEGENIILDTTGIQRIIRSIMNKYLPTNILYKLEEMKKKC